MRDAASLETALAALAVGALPPDEAGALAGLLAIDARLRETYGRYQEAAAFAMLAAQANKAELDRDSKDALKERILRGVGENGSVPRVNPTSAAEIVPTEKLVRFADGIYGAALHGNGMTVIYWIFEPPACGDLPLETHVHEQCGYVLDGEFTLLYAGGRSERLTAGDRYRIAPNVLHGATFQLRTTLCDVYVPNHLEFEECYARLIGGAS